MMSAGKIGKKINANVKYIRSRFISDIERFPHCAIDSDELSPLCWLAGVIEVGGATHRVKCAVIISVLELFWFVSDVVFLFYFLLSFFLFVIFLFLIVLPPPFHQKEERHNGETEHLTFVRVEIQIEKAFRYFRIFRFFWS